MSASQVRADLQPSVQSQVTLDVISLAELQRLVVPHTDDGLKYQYRLEGDQYGTVPGHAHIAVPPEPVATGQTCNVSHCPPSVSRMPRHSPGSV